MTVNARQWFRSRGWTAFSFQRAVWTHARAGRQGLIHAATGTGKTYAVWFAALEACCGSKSATTHRRTKSKAAKSAQPIDEVLQLLWITPMRALAADLLVTLRRPIEDLHFGIKVETRTGDTSSSVRQRQRRRMPHALVTTPESLSLLLSDEEARDRFSCLRMVVVDEWHELLGTKRGVQTELALARLRTWSPSVRTWGLSATIGNLEQALISLLGVGTSDGVLVEGRHTKRITIDALLPERIERFPWAGHLGAHVVKQVGTEARQAAMSLVFTNTRSQAEAWYQLLLDECPQFAGAMALHHGSLSAETRGWVESQLRAGTLRCVVSTSSLDLGVDFPTVDRVFQIGSPKAVSRLIQRAGRSGHRPGAASRATIVPKRAARCSSRWTYWHNMW